MTLRRELFAELGFKVAHYQLFRTAWHRKVGPNVRPFSVRDHTYRVRWHSTKVRLSEGKASRWFTLQEAFRLRLPRHERSDLLLLQKMRRKRSPAPAQRKNMPRGSRPRGNSLSK